MGELWRDLVEALRKRPALWLPVLVADVACYLLNLSRLGVLRAVVFHQATQRSVLGGTVTHGQMTASAMETTAIIALLLTWLTYFGRILLYAAALIATAALVQAFAERAKKPAAAIGPAFARLWGGILELALRGLAVYAVAALLFSWLTPFLARHGHTALLRSPWFSFGASLVVLLILSATLPPVALRVLSGRSPDAPTARISQQIAVILATVAAVLTSFVGSNSRELAQVAPGARYPLEIIGSLVVALPYALLFTGLALLARRVAREQPELPEVR